MNGDTFIAKYTLLFTANSANANYSGQSFCLWSTKNQRYCSNFWFICSVCLSVCGWKAINSFISISNILFSSLVNCTANCGPLFNVTLSGNLYNFYIIFLNNLANPSTDILFVVAIKYVILDNLLQTTRIASFLATSGNLVIKSTVKYIHSFSGTSLSFNFPATSSILFFILWHILHPFIYLPISLITLGHQ